MNRKTLVGIPLCLMLLFAILCTALNILLWSVCLNDCYGQIKVWFMVDRVTIHLILTLQVLMVLRRYSHYLYRENIARSVAHNVKTPIAVLFASNSALSGRDGLKNDAFAMKLLEISNIRLGVLDRMADMVLTQFNFSPSVSSRITDVDVRELCDSLAQEFRLLYPPAVIDNDIAPGLCVKSDPDKLRFVLSNLMENAIKYSRKIPSIRFYSYLADDKSVNLAVEDHGKGIPRGERRKVFRRYYRGKSHTDVPTSGFGLGLFLVRRECRHNHWRISINDTPGGGSTFVISVRK